MSVLALIPARSGSKGIPNKNFRELGGKPLWFRAAECAHQSGIDELRIVLSTDREGGYGMPWIRRPAELAGDDVPMIAVVQHALAQIPGPPEQVIVLLQPTQPLRKPEHVRAAIALLQSRKRGLHSVVSVVEIPRTHAPECVLRVYGGDLSRAMGQSYDDSEYGLEYLPVRRQDVEPAYIRDGTVYAFYRRTVTTHGNLYGLRSKALIIDPADSCELDTEDQWAVVEQRWKARHG